jgi:two-component SAPR family response regulator
MTIEHAGAFDASWYYYTLALEALHRKYISFALINQKIAMRLSLKSGSINQIVVNYLQMSQILHALSEDEKALYYLFKAHKLGKWSTHIEYMYLITRAQIALDQGNEKIGLRFLKRAMQLGQDKDYINFPGFIPSVMSNLCVQALNAGINKEYVKSLIKRRNLIPATPPYECEEWPWAFKVFTLGRQKLFIEDKPLEFNRKAQKKPLEMLQLLIASGGEDVSEEHIIDALWKDADGDRAKHSFETTLHRLRELLDNDKAIVFNAGRLTLDKRYCWVDTWAIEHLFDKAESLLKNHSVNTRDSSLKRHKHSTSVNGTSHSVQDEISSAISQILSLYHGPFLGKELSYPWAENYRERLQRRFLNILEETGQYFETNGEWKTAIEYYNKGLEVDHLKEIFYQRLMACHIHLGRKSEAMSIYHSCCKNLEEDLGIEPSDITKTIYISLQMRQ